MYSNNTTVINWEDNCVFLAAELNIVGFVKKTIAL